jgi:hypothetical protein
MMSNDSVSSQDVSNRLDGSAYQVIRIQTMRPKQSIAGKKLEREAQLRNRQNTSQILLNPNFGGLEFSLQSSSQTKEGLNTHISTSTNNLMPAISNKSMVLNIKKIETDQPFKSHMLDPFQNSSSNKHKTTFRNENMRRSKDKSLQTSSIVQISNQISKNKKKQRRKEIKKLKKIMTLKQKEQDEELKFVLNQERALTKLKKISEILKGHKITENCYEGEANSRTDNDGSKSEFTNHLPENSPWRGTLQKSNESKD